MTRLIDILCDDREWEKARVTCAYMNSETLSPTTTTTPFAAANRRTRSANARAPFESGFAQVTRTLAFCRAGSASTGRLTTFLQCMNPMVRNATLSIAPNVWRRASAPSSSGIKFLPDIGKKDFLRWRESKMRIDEWIAKEYPESELAKGRARSAAPKQQPGLVAEPVMFGLQDQPETSDAWGEGRE